MLQFYHIYHKKEQIKGNVQMCTTE